MHDIKYIRENPDEFDARLKKRGHKPMAEEILKIDTSVRSTKTMVQEQKSIQNKISKQIGVAKAAGDFEEFGRLRDEAAAIDYTINDIESAGGGSDKALRDLLIQPPNFPMEDVPDGNDETDNVELYKSGEPPKFDFEPKEHFDIPSVSRGMGFEIAGKISGSRFVLLSGAIARVHRALAQFMLDLHINEHELIEINPPVIVNEKALEGTGQLPKFADDCYKIDNSVQQKEEDKNIFSSKLKHKWLIPTSEVPLTNIVADMILSNDQLPLRYCAHSLCFRQEAGSAGRDTTGMLRQHQFEKVEMVSITAPEKSREELDIMTTKAEAVLKKLDLAFRTVVLCTGDMGFSAQRTHDIEVWLPGQNRYREISSVSVCGDFQARRMNARFREKDGDKPQFVHTLNGSGVAVGRCLIAVLENGQQKDGSVKLPKALHPYLGGKDTINPDGILEKAT